jgi:hypothetical protein
MTNLECGGDGEIGVGWHASIAIFCPFRRGDQQGCKNCLESRGVDGGGRNFDPVDVA